MNIPRILNCAAVKLFTILDDERQVHQNPTPSTVAPRISQLAICQAKADRDFSLFFCDGEWKTLHTERFASIDAAMARIEETYPGAHTKWLVPNEAARQRHLLDAERRCSFCGKTTFAARKFIAGDHAYICHDCIERLYLESHRVYDSQHATA